MEKVIRAGDVTDTYPRHGPETNRLARVREFAVRVTHVGGQQERPQTATPFLPLA